ncbi:MAG TPA: hypothetical protein VHN20_06155, partial [Beijerinckiaceae bacterium]|nr:hypothetical protein [Beijerinckiaceae bacterium]
MSGLRDLRHSEWARFVLPAVAFMAVALYPIFADPLSGTMGDVIVALAYVVMALGLNIVVGFAGLLDLGYVAFYAFGALATGWLASDFLTGAGG